MRQQKSLCVGLCLLVILLDEFMQPGIPTWVCPDPELYLKEPRHKHFLDSVSKFYEREEDLERATERLWNCQWVDDGTRIIAALRFSTFTRRANPDHGLEKALVALDQIASLDPNLLLLQSHYLLLKRTAFDWENHDQLQTFLYFRALESSILTEFMRTRLIKGSHCFSNALFPPLSVFFRLHTHVNSSKAYELIPPSLPYFHFPRRPTKATFPFGIDLIDGITVGLSEHTSSAVVMDSRGESTWSVNMGADGAMVQIAHSSTVLSLNHIHSEMMSQSRKSECLHRRLSLPAQFAIDDLIQSVPRDMTALGYFILTNVSRECNLLNSSDFLRLKPSGATLKLGYLSLDLREHAIGKALLGVFAWHNRWKYKVTAIQLGTDIDRPNEDFMNFTEDHMDINDSKHCEEIFAQLLKCRHQWSPEQTEGCSKILNSVLHSCAQTNQWHPYSYHVNMSSRCGKLGDIHLNVPQRHKLSVVCDEFYQLDWKHNEEGKNRSLLCPVRTPDDEEALNTICYRNSSFWRSSANLLKRNFIKRIEAVAATDLADCLSRQSEQIDVVLDLSHRVEGSSAAKTSELSTLRQAPIVISMLSVPMSSSGWWHDWLIVDTTVQPPDYYLQLTVTGSDTRRNIFSIISASTEALIFLPEVYHPSTKSPLEPFRYPFEVYKEDQPDVPIYCDNLPGLPNCCYQRRNKTENNLEEFTVITEDTVPSLRGHFNLPACPLRITASSSYGYLVLASIVRPNRVSPWIVTVWFQLMLAVQQSVLWIKQDDASAKGRFLDVAASYGISPGRIFFFGERLSALKYLQSYGAIDLILDTPFYNAHSTALDAIWSGTPILTMISSSFPGRVGASFLKGFRDLKYLVTYSWREYFEVGLHLLQNPQLLARLRTRILSQTNTASLFDSKWYAQKLEHAVACAWDVRTWQADIHFQALKLMRTRISGPAVWSIPSENSSTVIHDSNSTRCRQFPIVGKNYHDWCGHHDEAPVNSTQRQILCYWVALRSTQRAYRQLKYGFYAWHLVILPSPSTSAGRMTRM